MYKSVITSLLFIACSTGAWSQGTSGTNGQPPKPGQTGQTSGLPGISGIPTPASTFKAQCITSLTGLATEKLRAQLLTDKAVTNQVRGSAEISESQLGASCNTVCDNYALVSNKISWAKVSPGFLSEPEHTLQMVYKQMSQPPVPGKTELQSCLPQMATMNWCPPSGSGVGAGPTRHDNPLDKIKVCITPAEALQHMNFTAADAAHQCARPAIVDAAQRIQAEQQCVADFALAEKNAAASKAAADKAAANGAAQLPMGNIGMSSGARKKP
jgi:hypothetical protein